MGLVYSLIYDTPVDEKSKDENNMLSLEQSPKFSESDINEFNIVSVNPESSNLGESLICNSVDLSMALLPELVKFSLENTNLPQPPTLDEPLIENNNINQYEIYSNDLSSFEKLIQIPSHTFNDYKKLQNKPFNTSHRRKNKKKF
jgi:hypothetical protein